MVRLKAQEREELVSSRRAQILEAALRLMAKDGFAATSMEDVARAARVAKGTVYLYFSTKEALLEALFETQSMLNDIAPLIQHLRPGSTLEEIVETAVPHMWDLLHSRREALLLLLREGTGYGAMFIQRMVPFNEMMAKMLADKVGPERAASVDPFVAIRALVSMLTGLFIEQEIFGGSRVRPIDSRVLTASITELFLHGVRGSEVKRETK
jgi:AcrR family transcriptional regulator